MKIDANSVQQGLLDVAQRGKTEKNGQAASGSGEARTGSASDAVALSAQVETMKALAAEIKDVSAVDQERVAGLRAQIANGAFTPSAEAIAEAMFGDLVGL